MASANPSTASRAGRGAKRVVGLRPTVLSLEGVDVGFDLGPRRIEVLRAASLTVAQGELVAVVGRSGSGKSTLLHAAGGMVSPDRGRVQVGEHDLGASSASKRAAWRRCHLGFVFQSFHLLGSLTVAENVALPLTLDGRSRRDALARAGAMIDAVGLTDRRDHMPGELSGGEQQRVAVARALVNRPTLVLADEPTGNLDATTATELLDLFVERIRNAGTTCVLVTHDPMIAARADRVLTMRDGGVA